MRPITYVKARAEVPWWSEVEGRGGDRTIEDREERRAERGKGREKEQQRSYKTLGPVRTVSVQ